MGGKKGPDGASSVQRIWRLGKGAERPPPEEEHDEDAREAAHHMSPPPCARILTASQRREASDIAQLA